MLEGVSLRDCFKVIIAAEDVTLGKPNPQGYRLAAQKISEKTGHALKPAECLVVEDAPTVIRSVTAPASPRSPSRRPIRWNDCTEATYAVESLNPAEVKKRIPIPEDAAVGAGLRPAHLSPECEQ